MWPSDQRLCGRLTSDYVAADAGIAGIELVGTNSHPLRTSLEQLILVMLWWRDRLTAAQLLDSTYTASF